jgi:hypothetical protein
MQTILQSLIKVLNTEIKLTSNSTEDIIEESNRFRNLTISSFNELPLERTGKSIFRLRYVPHGPYSSMIATSSFAWPLSSHRNVDLEPNALSMAIEFNQVPISSISIVLSGGQKLSTDIDFPIEMKLLRAELVEGLDVCELTNFQINKDQKSKHAIAGLFHLLYLYCRQVKSMGIAVVKTKDRHAKFYIDMFGFEEITKKEGVTLMKIDFNSMKKKIRLHGGTADTEQSSENGLYPFFFASKDEAGLLFRLLDHINN